MLRRLSLTRVALFVVLGLALAVAILWYLPASGYYIFLPDRAHPLAPIIHVAGAKPDTGGIYFVDVSVRKARLLERLFPGIHDGATLQKSTNVLGGLTEDVERRAEVHAMSVSQQIAAAVVFRTLGYPTNAHVTGALILGVDASAPAARVLRPGDVLVAVDGKRVRAVDDLRRLLGAHKPGDDVRLRFRRAGRVRAATVRLIHDPHKKSRPLLGVNPDQAVSIKLPRPVRVEIGGVGGSSAGLAFALELMQKLGRDVEHGHKIAATGALGLDGSIGEIGGVEQKTIGAREAGVDAFLVPAGPNAREARRYAHGLRIIPVKTFPQALQVLATLPHFRA
jgi:PDZ domain-containing protein